VLKVAVLDDFIISDTFNQLTKKHIDVIKLNTDYKGSLPDLTHGTVVAAIFSEFAEADSIIGVSLGNDIGEITTGNFVTALNWCMNNRIDLICMSFGTIDFIEFEAFASLIIKLADAGVVMIAAGLNTNKITYPASLPQVIGVKYTDLLSNGKFTICTYEKDGIDIKSSLPDSKIINALKDINDDFSGASNSLVTPYIGGLITQYISKKNKRRVSSIHRNLCLSKFYSNSRITKEHYERNSSIPIISITGCLDFVLSLQRKFIKENFLSSVLSPVITTDYYKNIFSINKNEIEEAVNTYAKLCSADIIFVHNPDNNYCASNWSDVALEATSNIDECFNYLLTKLEYEV